MLMENNICPLSLVFCHHIFPLTCQMTTQKLKRVKILDKRFFSLYFCKRNFK